MIDCIFTLDYEIYGNGTGGLRGLVLDPAERLRQIFRKWDVRFVNFVEVAEFERIEAEGSGPAIAAVLRQIRELHGEGFETALHLHPQWYNARHENGGWVLDMAEYNLCTLPRPRIEQIVDRALAYLRRVLGEPGFTPLAFRAGNWLFQPTAAAADVLGGRGIKIDSSVFKGGLQRYHGLDYRPARGNGNYWNFSGDVNREDGAGAWLELPIHAEMVPFWRMATGKRLGFNGGGANGNGNGGQEWQDVDLAQGAAATSPAAAASNNGHGKRDAPSQPLLQRAHRVLDLMRFEYPMKLDFCRMTLAEMTGMVHRALLKDRAHPELYWPMVAIGHTKDLSDPRTVDDFLGFLRGNGIGIATFAEAYGKLGRASDAMSPRALPGPLFEAARERATAGLGGQQARL